MMKEDVAGPRRIGDLLEISWRHIEDNLETGTLETVLRKLYCYASKDSLVQMMIDPCV